MIKTLITLAAVIGVDETTLNVAGRKHWLHVARTDLLTAYHLHESRGRVAAGSRSTRSGCYPATRLPGYPGTVVHDALSVYDGPDYDGPDYRTAAHALCGAHPIRERTAIAEQHPEQIWPGQARPGPCRTGAAGRCRPHRPRPRPWSHPARTIRRTADAEPLMLFRHAVLVGPTDHRRTEGRKQSKARTLLERLRDREHQILRCTTDLAVPFTNNGSERDLRPVKTQIKISGCHRATTGAVNWLRVRGYISTVRKHGGDVPTALRDAITGHPWSPPIPVT